MLLAGSATAASGLDGRRLKSGTVSERALSETVGTQLSPASAPARLGAVRSMWRCRPARKWSDAVVVGKAARAQLVRVGECRAGSDWRRVREIVKEVGHLLGLHRRGATRLTDLHRVKQLDELIPALGQGSRSAGRDLGFLTFSSKGEPRRRRRGQ